MIAFSFYVNFVTLKNFGNDLTSHAKNDSIFLSKEGVVVAKMFKLKENEIDLITDLDTEIDVNKEFDYSTNSCAEIASLVNIANDGYDIEDKKQAKLVVKNLINSGYNFDAVRKITAQALLQYTQMIYEKKKQLQELKKAGKKNIEARVDYEEGKVEWEDCIKKYEEILLVDDSLKELETPIDKVFDVMNKIDKLNAKYLKSRALGADTFEKLKTRTYGKRLKRLQDRMKKLLNKCDIKTINQAIEDRVEMDMIQRATALAEKGKTLGPVKVEEKESRAKYAYMSEYLEQKADELQA